MTSLQNNPLLNKNLFKNGVPPYDKIKTEHFIPALEEAIKLHKQEIDNVKTKQASFENTIEGLENAGSVLDVVVSVFFHFDGVCATEELEKIALEFKTKLTAHYSDLSLDEELFKKVKAVYDVKDSLKLNRAQEILLDDSYKSFSRNGALLEDEAKEKLRKIDEKLAELKNNFSKNLLGEINAFELYIENESELSGIPDGVKQGFKEAAKEKGQENKYFISLHIPSVIPVLTYADNKELREKIWYAHSTRCKTGKFQNNDNVLEIVKLRDERSKLLGYTNHAEYILEERMAKNTSTVMNMLGDYKEKVKPIAEKEHKDLQDFANNNGLEGALKPWDLGYYAEKMKQDKFGYDSEELRPYFEFSKVMNGAFEVASKLYNIKIEKSGEYPVWHKDVETYEVKDGQSNELIGIFYTDYFPRSTKRGGAWMNDYVAQARDAKGKRLPPVIGNHGNFTKPTSNTPSLLNMEEVLTLFHEFGHGLHGLLSDTEYRSQAGTSVKWDFVELPSQILENWVKEKEVLDIFAEHYETGEKMPAELIEKMKAADNFRSASFFFRQIHLASLDMAWHVDENPENIDNVEEFERKACEDFYIINPEDALFSPSFSHIFDGGYSAGYYSYKWAEILDADAFEAFKENGLFDKETANKFRKMISSGGSENPEILYVNFRGKKPDPEALLRREGLV